MAGAWEKVRPQLANVKPEQVAASCSVTLLTAKRWRSGTRRRRGRPIAAARTELEAWKAEHPHANADPAQFAVILRQLGGLLLCQIMAATGVSKATASSWRSGRHTPALRHWPAT